MRLLYFFIAFNCFCLSFLLTAESPDEIVKNKIESFQKQFEIPGIAVALVYKNHSSILQFGYADLSTQEPITANTIFDLASITKVFTSTALAIEVIKGNMHLKDSVTKYIPSLSGKNAVSEIKLIDLATHTSSLPRTPPQILNRKYTEERLITFLRNWKPDYPIGTKFLYSNLGFGVLGMAVANVEKTDYEKMIEKLITQPLQMGSTFVNVPEYLYPYYAQGYTKNGQPAERFSMSIWPGGGALKSSISDMLKFLKASLGFSGPSEIIQAMQLSQDKYFDVKKHFAMGLGWGRFSKNRLLVIEKNGGLPGFSTYIGFLPKENIGIVILTNKAKTHVTKVGREILKSLSNL